MKALIPTVALVTLFGSGVAAAQCVSVDPVLAPQVRLDPLDASGAAQLVQPMSLVFRRIQSGGGPVMVRYQIVDEDSAVVSRVGVSQGPQVEWQSSDSPRDIAAFRSEAYPLLRVGRVVLGQDDQVAQTNLNMRLVNLRADLPAGVYREQFTVRYWCGPDEEQGLPYEAQGAVAVSVAVPNVISASVAGASTRGEIDFMDFAVRSRQLQISVRSTGPYRVSARSQNQGVLVRDGVAGGGDAADRIVYRARLDDQPLDLNGADSMRLERAGLGGRQAALDVEVAGVEANRAGTYRDTLFLTLSPAI